MAEDGGLTAVTSQPYRSPDSSFEGSFWTWLSAFHCGFWCFHRLYVPLRLYDEYMFYNWTHLQMQKTCQQVWEGSLFLCLYRCMTPPNTESPGSWRPDWRWRWRRQKCCTLEGKRHECASEMSFTKEIELGLRLFWMESFPFAVCFWRSSLPLLSLVSC